MLEVTWTVLEEPQFNRSHINLPSTGWFFSMGSELTMTLLQLPQRQRQRFFLRVVHVTNNAEIFFIRNSFNSVITRFLVFLLFLMSKCKCIHLLENDICTNDICSRGLESSSYPDTPKLNSWI